MKTLSSNKKLLLIAVISVSICISSIVLATIPFFMWSQTYETPYNRAYSLVETSDGGFAVAGDSLFVKTDAVGNIGASEVFFFTIAESFPAIIAIASVSTVVAIGIGLLFYFKKRKQ